MNVKYRIYIVYLKFTFKLYLANYASNGKPLFHSFYLPSCINSLSIYKKPGTSIVPQFDFNLVSAGSFINHRTNEQMFPIQGVS